MSSPATRQRINELQPDFVVVSLGAHKGQAWIEHNRRHLHTSVISHLGAVVNMVAGTIRRAPLWMQLSGLEWLWRIREEPTLWRRYFDDGKTLLRLMLTRVFPLVIALRLKKPRQNQWSLATLNVTHTSAEVRIQLTGVWGGPNLSQVRATLQQALLKRQGIRINLEAVTFVDSAFLGLLMLMFTHQMRSNLLWQVAPVSDAVRRIGYLSGASFLWDSSK